MERPTNLHITFDPSGLLSLFSQAICEIVGCASIRIFRVSPGDELVLVHAENPSETGKDEKESSTASISDIDLWVGRAFRSGTQQQVSKQELREAMQRSSTRGHLSPTETCRARLWSPLHNDGAESVGILELSASDDVDAFSNTQLNLAASISRHLGQVVVRLAQPPCRENSEQIYLSWMGIWSLRGNDTDGAPRAGVPDDQKVSRFGEEKMAGIARLAAGIAHEINNPLAVASANVGQFGEVFEELVSTLHQVGVLIADGAWEDAKMQSRNPELASLIEDTQEMANETKDALGRIAKVVSQMMKFGEQSAEKVEEIDLVEEAQRAVELFRLGGMPNSERRANIHLECHSPVKLCASRNRVRQIFVELLENAIRAANQNPKQGEVYVRVHLQNAQAVLEIQDNGPGIDFESQQRIFDPFYTTKRNWRSTGLGLTAVYGIVKAMNGSILLQSSPGNGAHFSIHLPTQGNPISNTTEDSGPHEKSGRYYEDLR